MFFLFLTQFVFIDRTKTNEFTEKDQQIKESQSKYDQLNKENNDLRQQIEHKQRETEIQINQLQKEFHEKRQTNEQTQSEFIQRVSLLKKNFLDNFCNYLDGKYNKRI